MDCKECHGRGYVIEEYIELDAVEYECWLCHGNGKINIFTWLYYKLKRFI
jgi:DnaJ-class molecular chaperone